MHNGIPGARIIPILGGIEPTQPVYYLPGESSYRLEFASSDNVIDGGEVESLAQEAENRVVIFSPEFSVAASDFGGATPRVEFDRGQRRVVLRNALGDDLQLSLHLDESESEMQIQLRSIDLLQTGVLNVSAADGQGKVIVRYMQSGNNRYDLSLVRVGEDGRQTFAHPAITVTPGATHAIDYGHWDGAGPVRVEIDRDSDGEVDEVRELANVRGVFLPLVKR